MLSDLIYYEGCCNLYLCSSEFVLYNPILIIRIIPGTVGHSGTLNDLILSVYYSHPYFMVE